MLKRYKVDRAICDQGLAFLRRYRKHFEASRNAFGDYPRHDWTSHAADAFRMSVIGHIGSDQNALATIARARRLDTMEAAVVDQY